MRVPSSNRKSSSLCHCTANQGSCGRSFLDLKPHSNQRPDSCSTLTPIFGRWSQQIDCSVTGWLRLLFIRMNEASDWSGGMPELEPHDTRNYKNKILNNLFTHAPSSSEAGPQIHPAHTQSISTLYYDTKAPLPLCLQLLSLKCPLEMPPSRRAAPEASAEPQPVESAQRDSTSKPKMVATGRGRS